MQSSKKYKSIGLFLLFFPCLLSAQVEKMVEEAAYNYQRVLQIYTTDLDSALIYINKAAQLYEAAEKTEEQINCLNALSSIYFTHHQFEANASHLFQTLDLAQKLLGSAHPQSTYALNNLTSYYYNIGNFEKAAKNYQEVIRIKQKEKDDPLEIAIFSQNLANTLKFKGDFEKAVEIYKKSIDILEQKYAPTEPSLADAYMDMALLYKEMKDWNVSFSFLEKSFNILKKKEIIENTQVYYLYVKNLQWLAENSIELKKWKAADRYLAEALKWQKAENAYRKFFTYELMSQLAKAKGDLPLALAHIQKADLIARTKSKRNTPPFIARRSLKMAAIQEALGQSKAALNTYQYALQILSPDFQKQEAQYNPPVNNLLDPLDALLILSSKAALLWQLYQDQKDASLLDAAYETYLRACQVIRTIRQGIQNTESKNALATKVVAIYEGAIRTAKAKHQLSGDPKYLEVAFTLAESNKALLLLESLQERVAKGTAEIPDSLLLRERDLQIEQNFWHKKILEERQKDANKDLKVEEEKRFQLSQQLDELRQIFEKKYPRYFELKYQAKTPSLSHIRSILASPKQALLEYFVGEEATYLFILSDQNLYLQEIASLPKMEQAIQLLQSQLSSPPLQQFTAADFQIYANNAHQLFQVLLADGLEQLGAQVNSLIIVPDYQLNYVPFEILLRQAASNFSFAPQTLAYVFEDYAISYSYSATLLLRNHEPNQQEFSRDFLGFAPDFPAAQKTSSSRACRSQDLYRLQCSEQEVEQIKDLLDGESRLNEAANKQSFTQEATATRILHLATHACVNESEAAQNKIFLSGDYLSDFDLYQLQLNAELAVLSACNTGAGTLVKGEGVMSLARGFLHAGCQSTLISMWSVDDCATNEVMFAFYKNLKAGFPKDQALQQAKLDYLMQADKLKQHPYYWAPFLQFGNAQALNLNHGIAHYWWFLLGFFGLLGIVFWWKNKSGPGAFSRAT